MIRHGTWIALALAVAGCQSGTTLTRAQREALADSGRRLVREFAEVVNSNDLAAVLRYYRDDPSFHWVEDGIIAYPSRAAVEAVFDSLQGAVRNIRFIVDAPRVVPLAPGLLLVSATYRQTLTDTAGQSMPMAGAFTTVAVHGDSGWQFLVGHTSTSRQIR